MPSAQAAATSTRSMGFVILTLAFRKEGRVWVGTCLELGTSTYARSFERVRDELVEMVDLHLNALEDLGERERFFQEQGIRFYTGQERPVESSVPIDRDQVYQPHLFEVSVAACLTAFPSARQTSPDDSGSQRFPTNARPSRPAR